MLNLADVAQLRVSAPLLMQGKRWTHDKVGPFMPLPALDQPPGPFDCMPFILLSLCSWLSGLSEGTRKMT